MNNRILWQSMAGGIISVIAFSLTAPATKVAVSDFTPLAVTGMRGLIAGLFCIGYLIWKRNPIPSRSILMNLFAVAAVGSAGFSTFLALGLQTVSATHATVFLAVMPLATALLSQVMMKEKTSPLFWFGAFGGAAVSFAYMVNRSHGHIAIGDVFLLISVLAAAWGYVRVAQYTKILGGISAMSWLLVVGSPIFATLLFIGTRNGFTLDGDVSTGSLLSLLYLGTVSQSLGMFLWCWSLSTGFASVVSQTQMIQPFLSLMAAHLLLGEPFESDALWVTALVMVCVAISTYARVNAGRRPHALAVGKA